MNPEQIKNIAELARIDVTEHDIKGLQKELVDILDFIGTLQKTEYPDKGEPVMNMTNVFQDDKEHGELKEKGSELIKLAPKTKDSQVLVPHVLDNTEL